MWPGVFGARVGSLRFDSGEFKVTEGSRSTLPAALNGLSRHTHAHLEVHARLHGDALGFTLHPAAGSSRFSPFNV